jgi:hypothetical protein
MNEKLKEQINEIITTADTCPELYKVECFKILLSHYLRENICQQSEKEQGNISESEDTKSEKGQREIRDSDLDFRFRKYMEKYTITLDKLNQLFYFKDGAFLGMYDNLKTLKAAEFQIRVALLHSMINAMSNGDFEFDGEAVRAECQMRKVHDAKNFATIFKNNARFFTGFDVYKRGTSIRLSDLGKEELSKVIKDILI